MALQAKVIKQKIKAVGNIKKITKTMEMVSVSKMRKSVSRAVASKSFALYALELLLNISLDRHVKHPFLERKKSGKTLLVIMASNKGLCGGYNAFIARAVAKFIRKHEQEIECVTVGKYAEKIARRNKLLIKASFTEFSDFVETNEVQTLSRIVLDEFKKTDQYQNVIVISTAFIKSLVYQPEAREILPINPLLFKNIIGEEEGETISEKTLHEYTLEPDSRYVLDTILPSLITSVLYQMILEAYASEHSSRMVAMRNATDNAGALQEALQLTYNKARQASITQEIAEIVGGANALAQS